MVDIKLILEIPEGERVAYGAKCKVKTDAGEEVPGVTYAKLLIDADGIARLVFEVETPYFEVRTVK